MVDADGTTRALENEALTAAQDQDGHRAWVIRDTLPKLDSEAAARIRESLGKVRRRADAPSTSKAAELATRFGAMGLGRRMPEPPLT
jgi:hypothetical protein